MAVTEVLRALGSWGLQIRPGIPQEIWDALGYFGHVAIHAGRVDPRVSGDSLLASARYVGVLRQKDSAEQFRLGGPGMAMWLGDEDGKGVVIENLLTITAQTFEQALRLILPPASSHILEGSYFSPGGPAFTGTFQWVTQREAINYLTDTFGADWKVLGTGRLNAGLASSLFKTNPTAAIVRRSNGVDLDIRAFPGVFKTQQDLSDFTTRVVLLADSGDGGVATGDADILPGLNPYKDVHGSTIKMTRLVSESTTDPVNAEARAQLQLNRFTSARNALQLSTAQYDVKGDVEVGDYVWVFDPDLDLFDNANEVVFRGTLMNPIKLRLVEMTWPVVNGMSVAYRDRDGSWLDLTDFVAWEAGDTELVVGDFNRGLNDGSDGGGGIGPQPQPDNSIPNAPTWATPFVQGTYQSPINGDTKAETELVWTQPTNTDGSAIADGDHYEIRYRSATTPLFPVTHAQMAVFTHAQLAANGGTFGQPIQYPIGEWQYQFVPFDRLRVKIYELSPSMPYEAQIRAIDAAKPPNAGVWSTLTSFQTAADTLGPATPAPPSVAASLIAVQVTHHLGKSSGGTFNLDRDLHHLEVHGEYEPAFTPSESTRLGRLLANWGMITGEIPVVGTFSIPELTPMYFKVIAVDNSGNKSSPSAAAVTTAQLIDDAHISSLTVSKVTAGTITASWVMAGTIKTADTGARAMLDAAGIRLYNAANELTVDMDANDGSVLLNLKDATSAFTVTDSGAVERLHVATSDVTIRDAAGNEVFSNESSQGWGITQPNLQTAFYPQNSDSATQSNTNDGIFQPKWSTGHIVNHPVVRFGVVSINSGAGSGFWRVEWFTYRPNTGNPTGGTLMASGATNTQTNNVYTFPSNMFGQLVFICYLVSMNTGTSGVDWVSAGPTYFYGAGS